MRTTHIRTFSDHCLASNSVTKKINKHYNHYNLAICLGNQIKSQEVTTDSTDISKFENYSVRERQREREKGRERVLVQKEGDLEIEI